MGVLKRGTPKGRRRNLLVKPERLIQAEVVEYLTRRGIVHSVTNADRTFGPDGRPRKSKVTEGWPDITGVINGCLLWLEMKSLRGRVRPAQAEMHKRLEGAGALGGVARSVEEVAEIIDAADRKTRMTLAEWQHLIATAMRKTATRHNQVRYTLKELWELDESGTGTTG